MGRTETEPRVGNRIAVAWSALMGMILGGLAGSLVDAFDAGLAGGLVVGLLLGLVTVVLGRSPPLQRTCRDCDHSWRLPRSQGSN